MRVVTVPIARGLPVIPGAALIKKEGNSGWYSVHFEPVNKRWIMLYELSWAPGTFLVYPNDDSLLRALPVGSAFDRRAWRLWRVRAAADEGRVGELLQIDVVPSRDPSDAEPWVIDGVSVTKADPVLRSRCGHVLERVLAGR